MSWIHKLYETYENCQSMIGDCSNENEALLLPICHTTQKAQIEIVIDLDGNFKRAKVVSQNDATTTIPCTESSGGRTSGEAPHPICDKLQYVAADYKKYGGNKAHYFESYRNELQKWCDSEYSNQKAEAVLKYVKKANVMKDLINEKVLLIGDDGMLLKKWDKNIIKDAPDSLQADSFVRWKIETNNVCQTSVWTDYSLFESWIGYYLSTKKNNELCYVTGMEIPSADQHPSKIRDDKDKAKLISSGKTKNKKGQQKVNDPTGLTFLGRFENASQACNVSFTASQKSHLALRWLIRRQGTVFYEGKGIKKEIKLAIVAWAISGMEIPDPMADAFSIIGINSLHSDSDTTAFTAQDLALRLKKKIMGYNVNIGNTTSVIVMGFDSATTGRLAITFYRELTGSEFIERINRWHENCAWIHDYCMKEVYDKKSEKNIKVSVRVVGAPAPNDIAEAAYGMKIDDKLRKSVVTRILPCIIDGQRIPRDLVESVVRRVSNRLSMENWEWNKTLSIACALYRNYYKKEGFGMALDENRRTREYLYGRLLALAESLEQWALNKSEEKRQTNAERLMQRFADHPYTTWRNIELALSPYKARLAGKSAKRQQLISEVIAMFETDDFKNDKRMSGEFLLGYHCQREALCKKNADDKEQVTDKG